MRLLRWTLMPWWLLQVFGPAKSFRDNPVLGSRTLNRLGLHATRYAIAHGMTALRRAVLSPLVAPQQRRTYRENGFVVIHDVLAADAFERLRQEIVQSHGPDCPGQMRECIQGDTATRMMLLDAGTTTTLPHIHALIADRRLGRLMMYIASRLKRPLFLTHTVEHGAATGGTDPQKDFHSDTFHATMKAWYFVSDVSSKDGPFEYIPGSHRFSRARRDWEYAQSLCGSGHDNRYASKGSLRLTEADRLALGLPEPVRFTVPANTLVIADTHGFHRRGDAPPGAVRVAIYASSRSNPFNPLPGLLPGLMGRLEAAGLRWSWRLADRKALARGDLPSWRLLSGERLAMIEPSVRAAVMRSSGDSAEPDSPDGTSTLKPQPTTEPRQPGPGTGQRPVVRP